MARKAIEKGVQIIAGLEATKGIVVILVGIGVLSILGQNAHEAGIRVVHYLGLQNSEYSAYFLEAFDSLGDGGMEQIAFFAFCYSAIRFVEAYGLWKQKIWAEWLAILSGAIYLPFEILKLLESFAWWKVAITLLNIFIVGYLVFIRARTHKAKDLL